MEEILEGLKQFILSEYNALVSELSTPDVPLKKVEERAVVIGEIDLDKYTFPHCVSIMPNRVEYEELSLGSNEARLNLELYIFVRKETPSLLYKQAQRLGQTMKTAIYADPTLDGTVEDCRVLAMEMYFGVEGDPSVQAVMLELELTYEEVTE